MTCSVLPELQNDYERMFQSFVRMVVNMMRNLLAQLHFDTGRLTNVTSPYASIPSTPPTLSGSGSRTNAFSPAVVAVIGVLAGAFLIVSYYRIFSKYCSRFRLPCWGTRINNRDDGPSAIVLMEEHIWPPSSMGLDESLINRIPTCKYDQQEGLVEGTECSVCLSEFEEGEVLRILPKCNHPFHIQCIDTWLQSHSTCPLCRVNIVLAAGLPFALMPLEMEAPVPGTFHALVPTTTTPIHARITHEIEMLQEQYMEELDGQMSGPTNSISITSSRADSLGVVAPDVQTVDKHQIYLQEATQKLIEHVRHLSLEQALIPTGGETATVTSSNHVIRGAPRLMTQLSAPTKRRPYSRTRSDRKRNQESVDRSRGLCNKSDRKGKHPVLQLTSPQMKRFAGLVRSHSAGSSSSNQMVVELLAQEIFNESFVTHAKLTCASSSSILETSVRKASKVSGSKDGSTTSGPGSSSTPKVLGNNNIRNARRMSSIGEEGDNSLLEFENETSEFVLEQHELAMLEMAHKEVTLQQRPKSTVLPEERKRRFSRGSCDDFTKSSRTFKVLHPGNAMLCDTWPQKSRSIKNSILKMKRCGSEKLSLQSNEKVHASEPVFELFDFC